MQTVVSTGNEKRREAVMFLALAVIIWPIIATAVVGAYGLAFWIFFMLAGPPGPT